MSSDTIKPLESVASLTCPSCRVPMQRASFERRLLGRVDLDLCFSCQSLWFDEHESLQLAPAGVIALFQLIHDHRDDLRQPLADLLRCPRCAERLIPSQDRVKSGLFNYLRCGQQHGRFTVFSQFMIEKGFVRQLTGSEINELKVRLGVIRCTGCGAPVDIRKESACSHCRAPIAILDATAVEKALAGYQQAAQRGVTAPSPELMAETIFANEHEKYMRQRERNNLLTADLGDLLLDGAEQLWRLIVAHR